MLTIDIIGNGKTLVIGKIIALSSLLQVSEKQLRNALKSASKYWKQFRQLCMEGLQLKNHSRYATIS